MKVDIARRGSVGEPLRDGKPATDRHEQITDEIEADQAMAPFDAEHPSGRDHRHGERRIDAETARDVLERLGSGQTSRRRLRDAGGEIHPARQQPDDRRPVAIGFRAVRLYDRWAIAVRHPCRRTPARQWQATA